MKLPRRPQFVRVELDEDMAPEGPLPGGHWPEARYVLTYHWLGAAKLRPGDRVCVNDGRYADVFGTVLGRSWRYKGYTYGVRRAHTRKVAFTVEVEQTAEFEVA